MVWKWTKTRLAILGIFVLGVIYFGLVINDSNQENEKIQNARSINLPYVLNVDYKYKSTEFSIEVESVMEKDLEKLDVIVVSPKGTTNMVRLENKTKFVFPNEFAKTVQPIEKGKYDVILYNSLNNSNITSVQFEITNSDLINSLSKRYLGESALAAIVTLSVPVGILVRYAHQLYSNQKIRIEQEIEATNLRLEKKLNWLQGNMKYYLRIAAYSFEVGHKIAKLFGKDLKQMANDGFDITVICSKDECKGNLDIGGLLDRIIKLVFSIKEFNKDIGYYYFDSVKAETYVNTLVDEVEKQSKHLFLENQNFLRFVTRYKKVEDDISYTDSKLGVDLEAFKEQLCKSICKATSHTCSEFKGECCKSNIECYYRNLLALWWVIHTCISKIAAISYSKENMKADMEAYFKTYEPQIQNHVLKSLPGIFGKNCVPGELWDEIFSFNPKNSK
jgi:hypothetical protein